MNIGTKLAISSLIILVLVAGMAAFGIETSTTTRSAIEATARATELVADIDAARGFAAETVLAMREMQLARDRSELARAAARAKKARADGTAESDKASRTTADAEAKQALDQVRERWVAFDQAAQRYSDLQRQALETRDDLFAGSDAAALAALRSAAGSAPPQALVMLSDLAAAVGGVRSTTWQYLVLREPDGPDQLADAAAKVNEIVRKLDPIAEPAPAFKDGLESAKRRIGSYLSIAAQLEKEDAAAQDALAKQVLKTHAELESALAAVSGAAAGRHQAKVAEASAASARNLDVLLGSAAACLVLIIAIAWSMTRLIARPVRQLTSTMSRLAAGELALQIPARTRKDEVGAMARAVEVFRAGLQQAETLRNSHEAQRLEAEQARHSALSLAAQRLDDQADEFTAILTAAATRLRTSSDTMSAAVSTASDRSGEASRATHASSANVDAVATAAEELAVATGDIGEQVSRTISAAGAAAAEADHSSAATDGLAAAAARIGDVVVLIQQIARQTNLLALNATIEAARAGDAGKGFAVVANEVKTLATQTAEATEEISGQVQEIRAATENVVASIGKIGVTVKTMNEIAAMVAATVEEQSSATQEIARSAQNAANGASAAASNVEQAATAASDAGIAAKDVLVAADEIGLEAVAIKEKMREISASIRLN
ncbi:MAG TPA: methyl-accepting chemotaxis protein [Aliidongia sp.]|nr:methyl-accepting chemotaxis protein [Aliidongia sp.]